MTIIEAINNIDAIKPNTYTQSDKVKWLSALDRIVKLQVIDTHEPEKVIEEITDPVTGETTEVEVDKVIEFDGYTDDTSIDTELLVGEPYTDIYTAWLESKIDYANAEYVRYNNSAIHYNDIYQDFVRYYNRTHLPLGVPIKYY